MLLRFALKPGNQVQFHPLDSDGIVFYIYQIYINIRSFLWPACRSSSVPKDRIKIKVKTCLLKQNSFSKTKGFGFTA